MGEQKFCPYCMRGHSEKGICCCPEHARRMGAHTRAVNLGRSRAVARIGDRQRNLFVSKRRWRDVAMGRSVKENLREIFGVDVE